MPIVRQIRVSEREREEKQKLIYPIDRKPINCANNEILFTQL